MKSIGRLLIALAVVIAANLIFWPPRTVLIDHSEKPEGRYTQRAYFENALARYHPNIILMGNSMLTEGIDPKAFINYTRQKTLIFSRGGSATAWWYLGLKNIIANSPSKPKLLAIFFRDDFLTRPDYRVKDTYKLAINDMANIEEPLLDRLAYLNGMDYPTYLLSKYAPLYQQKDRVRISTENSIKKVSSFILPDTNTEIIDSALTNVFDMKRMDKQLMTARQLKAESNDRNKAEFETILTDSFLPHIISIAKENDIQLVFLRVKRRRDVVPDSQPQEITKYIADLKEYLNSNSIELIDFTNDRRIKLEHFADGDHLNREKGRPLFTKITANSLMPLIQKHCK